MKTSAALDIVNCRSSDLSLLDTQSTSRVDVFMPYTDAAAAHAFAPVLASRANCEGRLILIEDDAKRGFLTVCNDAFRRTHSAFVVYLAQDAFPGRRWLELGLYILQTQKKSLLAFNDGKWFGQLAAFGLVRRGWVSGLYDGNLFHGGYHSHYADTELTLIAEQQGQLAFNPNALLMEVDTGKDGKPTHAADKALFAKRAEDGFDGRVTDEALKVKFR